jgi:hypothetical protein
MTMTLRCSGRVFGEVDVESGTLEVRCTRSRCGKTKENVVLHVFNLTNGELISTKTFANPPTPTKE